MSGVPPLCHKCSSFGHMHSQSSTKKKWMPKDSTDTVKENTAQEANKASTHTDEGVTEAEQPMDNVPATNAASIPAVRDLKSMDVNSDVVVMDTNLQGDNLKDVVEEVVPDPIV